MDFLKKVFISTILEYYFSNLVYLKIYYNTKHYYNMNMDVLQYNSMRFIFEYNKIIRVCITIIVL